MNFEFVPASSFSLFLFLSIVVSIIALFFLGILKSDSRLLLKMFVFFLFWLSLPSLYVFSGYPEKNFIPAVPIFVVTIGLCAILFSKSSLGQSLSSLPFWLLAAFQGFRFPLEIVLNLWAKEGTVPETMTWSGQNIDIVSGLLGILMFIPVMRTKKTAWLINIVGILLLMNVVRVVVMSSPFPFAWGLEKPLLLAVHMPYFLIGSICVWAAIVGHVLLTKNLLNK